MGWLWSWGTRAVLGRCLALTGVQWGDGKEEWERCLLCKASLLLISALPVPAFSRAVLAAGSRGHRQLQRLQVWGGFYNWGKTDFQTALMGSEHTGGNSYGELLPLKPFLQWRQGWRDGWGQDNRHSICFPEFLSCLPRPGAMLFCSSFPVSSEHLASQGDLASCLANQIREFFLKQFSYG